MTIKSKSESIEIVRDPARVTAETLQYPLALMRGYMPKYPSAWQKLVEMYGKQWNAELDLEPICKILGLRLHLGEPPSTDELEQQPYSPLGVSLAVQLFEPEINAVIAIDRRAVESLTTSAEFRAVRDFITRLERVNKELQKARDALKQMDPAWRLDKDGFRSVPGPQGGEPQLYVRRLTGDLWLHLRPIYLRASGQRLRDGEQNSKPLRDQIYLALSPFFPKAAINPEGRGPIASAINYAIHHRLDSAGP